MKRTSVAIIGIRGLGVVYSGFETFVNELVRNAKKGNIHYYLFARSLYQKKGRKSKDYKTITLPTINNKYLETPFYALLATVKSLFIDLDSVLYLGVANTPFLFLQKLRKRKIIVNVDGVDWKRKRWPTLGKLYLKLCERLSVVFADFLIADSKSVLAYYKKIHRVKDERIAYIAYGARVKRKKAGKTLRKFGLEKEKYFLFLGRLVPENCPEDLILALKEVKTNFKCAIVGGSYHEEEYNKYLEKISKNNHRIVFTGILKGKALEEVCSNAYAYIETKTAGGTHPSLLEAMAYKRPVISKNIKELKEVLNDCAIYYSSKNPVKTLKEKLIYLLRNPQKARILGTDAGKRVKKEYNWSEVISQYHRLFKDKPFL